MAESNPLLTLAGLGGLNVVGNLANTAYQDHLNREAEKRAYAFAQEAQVNAPSNYVAGLRKAGLPVSLALKGAFQTASTPSPMPAQSNPVDFTGAYNAAQTSIQNELAQSQLDIMEQQKIALEKKNQREADEDFTLDANLRSWLRSEADNGSPFADFYYALADSPELFSRGTLEAIKAFDATLTQLDDSKLKMLSNEFFKRVKQSELNNGIADVVAGVPERERVKFFADLSKVYTEISKLLVDTDLDKSKIAETMAHIKQIEGDTENAYYSNFTRLVRNKDYLSAGLSLFQSTLNAFSGALGAGTGFGVGSRLVGPKFSPTKPVKPKSNPYPHPSGYTRY